MIRPDPRRGPGRLAGWSGSASAVTALILVAACGGGGGDSKPKPSVGFSGNAQTASEGTVAPATIVLNAPLGSLGSDLSVTLRDAGTGSATAGSDHDLTADVVVVFPAGSLDGDTQGVPVALTADGSIEGTSETVELILVEPTGGGLKGASHRITITDADEAELSFALGASATANESSSVDVDVELRLDPGETLAVDVSVTLSDALTGSGSSGTDYGAVAQQVILFPAGSTHLATQSITLTPLDDTLVEGIETVALGLSSPTAGARLGTLLHVVDITDDETGGPSHLAVSGSLFGAPGVAVSDGDAFALGSAAVGSGPNGALDLTVQNPGGTSMQLPPLALTGDTGDFSVALQVPSTLMAPPVGGAFPFSSSENEAPGPGLELRLDTQFLDTTTAAAGLHMTDVLLPGGGSIELLLERVELPFAPDAELRVDGVRVTVEELAGDLALWRGTAAGYPDSGAFLALSSLGSHGWVDLGPDHDSLQLVTEYASGEPRVHWLRSSELEAAFTGTLGGCDGVLVPPTAGLGLVSEPPTSSLAVPLGTTTCRLAIETDYQFYSLFNNAGAATQYATQLIAAVSELYEEQAQVALSIAYLQIHTSSNDGWSAPETPGASASTLLNEFVNAWSGGWPASADLAHFISGAPLGGGVAYLGVVCNQSFGFGVSANINGNINWGSFTGAPSVANWDFVVVAHELGHNFGANHTHSYCPPLDECTSNCNGANACTQGTLMSYCHLCGGMANVRLDFHPFIAQEIRNEVASSCLPPASIPPGGSISLTVSLDPTSGAGAKAATLELNHSAPNEPGPMQVDLSGTAN